MSVTINIGSKTITKDGIIYISPNGNDSNDGLTESTPVKSYSKAIGLASDNYAIKFMEGTHTITSPTSQASGSATFYYIPNFDSATSGHYKKNILLYSDPTNTKIIIKPSSSLSNVYLFNFSNYENFIMCNLNIQYIETRTGSNFKIFNLSAGNVKIYNCIMNIIINGISKLLYDVCTSASTYLYIYNSIIYSNVISSTDYNKGIFKISNSITGNFGSVPTKSNCILFTPTSTSSEDVIEEAKSLCTDSIGIYSGDYSEWLSKIYLLFNKDTKKFLIAQDDKTFLVKQGLEECIESGLYPTISTLNNICNLLPDNVKTLMYKSKI